MDSTPMNISNDQVRKCISSAERMLHQARTEWTRGNPDDAVEFLNAAGRNVSRAADAINKTASVTDIKRGKEVSHAR